MTRLFLAALLLIAYEQDGRAAGLEGTWSELGGPGAARLLPCPGRPMEICGYGLKRTAENAVVPELGARVLEAVVAKRPGEWRGLYIDGSRRLPATLTLKTPDRVEMKVCVAFLCQKATYRRISLPAGG